MSRLDDVDKRLDELIKRLPEGQDLFGKKFGRIKE